VHPGDDLQSDNRSTLHDVAEEAGLSVTQTSRALNGHSDVADDTRQRVREVAHRLGYRPNLDARRLKKPDARTFSIGVILVTASQRLSDPFIGEFLSALVDEAAAVGYEVQLSAPLADEDPVASYHRAVGSNRVDGFVVLRTEKHDERVRFLVERAVPFVTFGRVPGEWRHASVGDSADCLQPAVDHLVALGHRRIGCLSGSLGYTIGANRHESFHRALRAHRLEADPSHVVLTSFREDAAVEATARLLAMPNPPTALVAFSDLLAIGAIRAATARNVDVPAQLSIIGFDNVQVSRFTSPPLTTLGHSTQVVGRHLITQLLQEIESPGTAEGVLLRPELIVRETTSPPGQPLT
jgi:LacI family transcriptional regulator